MIETLLARRLTTTTFLSLGVRAIVVERVGFAFFAAATPGSITPSKTETTADTAIKSVPLPRDAVSRLQGCDFCEFFMYIPSGVSFQIEFRTICAGSPIPRGAAAFRWCEDARAQTGKL